MPKAVPEDVSKPMMAPSVGKRRAAITLKKNITLMACATSSSSAPMTGLVAAIAEPPQIEDPTPMSMDGLRSTPITFFRRNATARDTEIVDIIIGSDWIPVCATTDRSIPKPRRTTAHCSIFFDVNYMPLSKALLSLRKRAMTIPMSMENTGPPTTGRSLPRKNDGTAIARHRRTPFHIDAIGFMPSFITDEEGRKREPTPLPSAGNNPRGHHAEDPRLYLPRSSSRDE